MEGRRWDRLAAEELQLPAQLARYRPRQSLLFKSLEVKETAFWRWRIGEEKLRKYGLRYVPTESGHWAKNQGQRATLAPQAKEKSAGFPA